MDTKRQELTEEDEDSSSIDLGKVSNTVKVNFFVFENMFTKTPLSITY